MPEQTVTRFAPSPNGSLHMGHAFSAIVAHDLAKAADGRFLLRIEDIDGPRSRPELVDEFRRDLEWLGLEWDEVPAQSTRLDSYREAAQGLLEREMLYRCIATRKAINALKPRMGEDGVIYPGTCKEQCNAAASQPDQPAALRLDVDRAMAELGELSWTDSVAGAMVADPREFGDVVIVRKDLPASYHLAVTLDDAADGVTLVTRGADLFAATHVHRLLQELLGLPVPQWHHHKLLFDANGAKLAKRRGSPALCERREAGEDGRLIAEQLRSQNNTVGT